MNEIHILQEPTSFWENGTSSPTKEFYVTQTEERFTDTLFCLSFYLIKQILKWVVDK